MSRSRVPTFCFLLFLILANTSVAHASSTASVTPSPSPSILSQTSPVTFTFQTNAATTSTTPGAVNITVDGNAGPWDPIVNPSYFYGHADQAAPASAGASNGVILVAGQTITVQYVSGLLSVGPAVGSTNANGDIYSVVNNEVGSDGLIHPSYYIPSSEYPVYLGEVVGTFADDNGVIVGAPFVLGNGPTQLTVPNGATQLLMGVNDNLFDDNTGAVVMSVSLSSGFDLSVGPLQASQTGATVNPNDSLLQVAPGTLIQISVPVSGSGFNSPETRNTTVTLQAGSQPLQSQTIGLANIQSGAVTSVAFTVTFDPSLAGTTQTITATIDAGNVLSETNFSNNTSSVSVDVISCTALINNALQGPSVENTTEITASFSPNFGYSLLDAAKICGYLNFDWQQTITNLPAPSPFFQASTVMNLVAPPSFLDPPPSGYTYQPQPDNSYPFYYDPNGELQTEETGTTLQFLDDPADPCLFGGSGSFCNGKTAPPGSVFAFTTHLVGVNPDGSATDLGIGFDWYTTFNGTSGGIATTKNANPPDKGSGSGGVTIVNVQKMYSSATTKPTPATLTSGNACNGTYGGSFKGTIVVSKGQSCSLVDVLVHGDIIVNGGTLSLSGTAVDGNVDIVSATGISITSYSAINGHLYVSSLQFGNASNQVCASSIYNGLWIHDNKADLQIGSSSQASCAGNVIVGNLEVYNNSGGVSVYGNYVSGTVVKDNSLLTDLLDLLFGNDIGRIALGLPLPRLCGSTEVGGNLGVYNNKGVASLYYNQVTNVADIYNDAGTTQVFNDTSKWLRCDGNKSISGGSDTAQLKQGQCSRY